MSEMGGRDRHDDDIGAWIDRLGDVPIAFGLRAQGHLPTVEAMLRDGCTWTEIGRAIGWTPEAAREFYEMEAHRG